MNIEVEIAGARRAVSGEELFALAARGELQPKSRIWVDGKETTCDNVKGIVFGVAAQQPVPSSAPTAQAQTAAGKRVSTPFLDYQILGGSTPYVVCYLDAGRSITSTSGGRVWMKGNIETKTESPGGFFKGLGRSLAGESFFMSVYTAQGPSEIVFSTKLPGMIVARELGPNDSMICQRGSYLASSPGVKLELFFQKRLGAGFFGGEGFIMQRISGPGVVFLELDGAAHDYVLQAGERILCDPGSLAWMDAPCSLDIEAVRGLKNMIFGGEGIFNAVVTGPGRVTMQSMSASSTARAILPFIPQTHGSN